MPASVTTCSELSRTLGEPLAGSGPVAAGWLCIEQPGPWGRKAVTQSGLDPGLGAELERRASGVRIGLIRRPGRFEPETTVDRRTASDGGGRTALLASTTPGSTWLHRLTVAEPAELLELDLAAVAAGVRPAKGEPVQQPVLLVCANSKRDRCCALYGRALAAELAAGGADVWESSHLGGHRFAPTGVVLPTGYSYGRWDAAGAFAVLAATAAGSVRLDRCRGRSSYDRRGQIAELAVREAIGATDAEALSVTTDGEAPIVRHRDGRAFRVELEPVTLGPATLDPCAGKDIEPGATVVRLLTELEPA